MKSMKIVIRELAVQLFVSSEASLPLTMRLLYDPGDPYAVRAEFAVPDGDETVEWIIGRDLLADSLEGPVGEGDIRIWPMGGGSLSHLYVLLHPPAGTALLRAPAPEIKAFLRETEALVPRGSETRHVDLGALLTGFLGEG